MKSTVQNKVQIKVQNKVKSKNIKKERKFKLANLSNLPFFVCEQLTVPSDRQVNRKTFTSGHVHFDFAQVYSQPYLAYDLHK